MEKKKLFEFPEAIIIQFNNEDIIVTSGVVDEWWCGKEGDDFWDD